MARNIRESHQMFLDSLGKHGQEHRDSSVRNVLLPPHKSRNGWSVKQFTNRWDLIDKKLMVPNKLDARDGS
ncbi:MAG: hypothetical protein JXQ25_06130 [Deltaproteobacteria bacterium]|nr:hypothetical protein [Deltaproteobacteria bacterium]